jgi:hypothetical protein
VGEGGACVGEGGACVGEGGACVGGEVGEREGPENELEKSGRGREILGW